MPRDIGNALGRIEHVELLCDFAVGLMRGGQGGEGLLQLRDADVLRRPRRESQEYQHR
jgi:hypothetical protein